MPVGNRLFRTPTVSLRNALGFTLKHAEKGDTPPRAKHSVQFCGAFARPPVFAVLANRPFNRPVTGYSGLVPTQHPLLLLRVINAHLPASLGHPIHA
jgi:hypothetical protein